MTDNVVPFKAHIPTPVVDPDVTEEEKAKVFEQAMEELKKASSFVILMRSETEDVKSYSTCLYGPDPLELAFFSQMMRDLAERTIASHVISQ